MAPRTVGWTEAVAAVTALAADRAARAARAARAHRAHRAGRTRFVGIDGRAGSGKTTLARDICAAVPDAEVVHVDDFAGPLVPEWHWSRLQKQVLDPLTAGHPARYQRWEWNRDEPAEWHEVPAGRLVVIEGVSSTRRELVVEWALQIWVDAPRDLRLQRAQERDGPDQLPHWLDVWMPAEEAYIARERPQDRVDLLVSGTARPPG